MNVAKTMKAAAWCIAASALLSACDMPKTEAENESPPPINAIDEANLTDIMLTAANPEDAAEYFRRTLADQPDRVDLKRGYAISLARSKKYGEAALAYRDVVETGQATPQDRIEYATILARMGEWDDVKTQLNAVPIGAYNVRYRMAEAMLADHEQDWATADAAYEAARQLSPEPAKVLNNWGVSRMARGDYKEAAKTFERAILYDPKLFAAKNNLALTYGLQKQYRVPVVSLTEEERGVILYNLAELAIKQGDKDVARGLLTQAIQIYPRHFDKAVDQLAALDGENLVGN